MAGRERGYGVTDGGVGGGGPGGVANFSPQKIFRAQREQLHGGAAGGGQSRAIESVQDMGLNDVWMDSGDRSAAALIGGSGGGGGGGRTHDCCIKIKCFYPFIGLDQTGRQNVCGN